MKRLVIALLLVATPLFAQRQKPVAVVNGQEITAGQLDQLYDHLAPEMRAQYERSGGKGAFLENYIRKVLILQEAKTKGFDQKPSVRSEMQAASDSALFDRYVRDVVANNIVTEAAMKAYYDAHLDQFKVPEMIKVRHIVIGVDSGPHPHTKAQALEIAKKALTDVITMIPRTDNPAATAHEHAATFGKLARAYSEDPAGPNGGDLGWVTREQLDPDFANVAFSIHTGVPSGIVQTRYGYHIIFVEGKRAAGTESFDEARPQIRNILLQQHAQDILNAVNELTTRLGDQGKVEVFPDNIEQ